MDNEHYIYARPVVVTEDRIKEAAERQAKQKALRAALDRQVREAERLKAEAHRAMAGHGTRVNNPTVTAPSSSSSAAVASVGTSSPAIGASTATPAGPSPPPPGTGGAVESTQYTFSFREGQGTFEVGGTSARRLQATLPPSAEGRDRGGGGGEGGRVVAAAPRVQPPSRELDGGAGRRTDRGGRGAAPTAASGNGEYQTNSLPLNFSMAKGVAGRQAPSRERRASDGSRPSGGASRERGGGDDASGRSSNKGSGGYDTQSLPVELIYKLGQAASNGSSNSGAVARPPLHRVATPQRSPSSGRPSEPVALAQVSSSSMTAAAVRDPFVSPLENRTSSPDWAGLGGAAAGGGRPFLSPRGGGKGGPRVPGSGGGTPKEKALGGGGVHVSPRVSARPAGGILPPLNARSDSDVIEMSAVLDAATPHREYSGLVAANGRTPGSAAQPSSRRRTSSTPAERQLRLSPPASPRDATAAEQARKQTEREKAWEEQVKKLKAELRKARAKGAGRGGPKAEERGGLGSTPRRAETAPDPPPHPVVRGGASGGIGGGAGGVHGRHNNNNNGGGGGGGGGRGVVGSGRLHPVEKMDFGKAHIFTRENFRPITAPEDATAYFGLLSPPPSLPPVVQPPKPRSREQQARPGGGGGGEAAGSKGRRVTAEEEAETTPAASSPITNAAQTFASTGTSGEESLKLASLTTRQVTLGLPDDGGSDPVPIQLSHLLQFVEAQIITATQAENLWDFFALSPDVAHVGGRDGEGDRGGSPHPVNGERGVWERQKCSPRSDSAGDAVVEVEVEEVSEERPATRDVGDEQGGGGGGFYTPHSPPPPPSAVLAPALRRKISRRYSEQEADAVQHLQPHKPVPDARRRVSPGGSGDRGVSGGRRVSPHKAQAPRRLSAGTAAAAASDRRGGGSDEDEHGTGTFDTYSELVLPPGLKDDEDEE
ncbi:hypothetical protein NESM_000470400 [Novymonas esmeraldas]|uniref:Uncharacterized protein n=1 Tax=Novymonas esmeraldas TaxID=1808958 RepID=A0AAW0EQA2_9TRYP